MTVRDLIELLQKMPPDAEVYYYCPPVAGSNFGEEDQPRPKLEDDGRVSL